MKLNTTPHMEINPNAEMLEFRDIPRLFERSQIYQSVSFSSVWHYKPTNTYSLSPCHGRARLFHSTARSGTRWLSRILRAYKQLRPAWTRCWAGATPSWLTKYISWASSSTVASIFSRESTSAPRRLGRSRRTLRSFPFLITSEIKEVFLSVWSFFFVCEENWATFFLDIKLMNIVCH